MDYRTILRKLALRDEQLVAALLADDVTGVQAGSIDARGRGLAIVGALVALDAAAPSYMSAIEDAFDGGATPDDIVAALVAILPVVGVARVVSAAPNVGLALGYDVTDALER